MKYIHIVVRLSLRGIRRHFPSSRTETPNPWNSHPPLLPLPALGNHLLLPISMNLMILSTSFTWNHTIFDLLWLVYFTHITSSRSTLADTCDRNLFLFKAEWYPIVYGHTPFCLSFNPLMHVWVAFPFWLFWIVLLWTWVYRIRLSPCCQFF